MFFDGNYFKNKKILIMGLGLLGGALNDTIYLAEKDADLLVTDIKTKEQLKESLSKLKKYKNIKYVLGKHRIEDFRDKDFILQPGNVPADSIYLAEAKKNNIPIFVSESLFAKCAGDDVKLIGITGTRGKSTVTQLIYEIIKLSGKRAFLGGNVKNVSTLSLLDQVKSGDIVVMELDSWALHGMGEIKRSPNVSVFTNFMKDHMNFYKGDMEKYFEDKSNVFKFQKGNDFLVVGKSVESFINKKEMKAKVIVCDSKKVSENFEVKLLGDHNLENYACALEVAKVMGISDSVIKKVFKKFNGMEGRMQLVKTFKGIKIYNDTNSTTPDATIVALKTLGKNKNIILILGGADKQLDMGKLAEEIKEKCKDVILLAGSGTKKLSLNGKVFDSLDLAFKESLEKAKKGDVILFSPAFASFGMFKNEYDRGEKFMKMVKMLR